MKIRARQSRRTQRVIRVFVSSAVAASLVGVAPQAFADQSEPQTVDVTQSEAGEVFLEGGAPMKTVASSREVGESITTAVSRDGEPATFVEQGVPANADVPELTAGVTSDPPSETNVGPVVEKHVAEALSEAPEDWRPVASYAYTRESASFTWLDSPVFDVVRDGVTVGQSSDGSFDDIGLKPGTAYSYQLFGEVNLNGEQVPASRSYNITTYPANPEAADKQLSAIQTYQPYTTAFTHITFIPEAQVSAAACNYGDSSYQFRGDNRNYSYPSSATPYQPKNYRTMMFANVNWDNPAPYDVITVKDVGQSVTTRNGQVVQSTYASTNQMIFSEISKGSAYAQVRFDHTASNPHCKLFDVNYGGAIRYNEIVRFYRNGTVEVVGYRQQAPAHEGYARFNTASGAEFWSIMFRKPNNGFNCLLSGACANETLNYSHSR